MTTPLIQIVPVRGIAPEGVGDYARLIAERLSQDHGRRTIFVSGRPLPPRDRLVDGWETHELPQRSARALLDELARHGGNTPILLHLSAYGYQDKGIPFWLVTALERWRRLNPATPLVTVFHELFATGPIWRRAFWLGQVQAHIARRIQRIATAGTTTTQPYAATLQRWRGDRPGSIVSLPVFSTIGEADAIVPATARPATLALFGRARVAQALYCERLPQLAAFVNANRIDEILDIGQRATPVPAMIGMATVRSMGALPGPQLQAVLADARFGLLEYDADRLAKSTIFAAYCANGTIPVCLSDAPGRNDGLRPGRNYLRLADGDIPVAMTMQTLEKMQDEALHWYRPHSIANSTAVLNGLLGAASIAVERD